MGRLINIDNGGTLTDICVIDGGRVLHTKVLTTPYDLSRCFFEGLRKASSLVFGEERVVDLLLSIDHIRYSTTQGTNALVERKGPQLGLIVSCSADVDSLKSTAAQDELLQALVGDRIQRFAGGDEPEAFDRAVVAAINALTAAGANRIVVSLSDREHRQRELRFKDAALRKFPRQLLGVVPILCAGDLVDDPEVPRRTWTALINSFLHPTMESFLYNAEGLLREYYHQHPLLIFRNDGDSSRVARTIAVKTYSSGPRGGMEGARALALHYGYSRLLSMDIGGTTTDIGLVEGGQVSARRRGEVEGVPVSLPLCEVASVGVGGSSILRVVDGSIRVGPESVGGAPGPACFGLGGQDTTITDVLLLGGLIDPATYFGGSMTLDRERAANAVMARIATPLGLSLEQALDAAEKAWVAKVARSLTDYTGIDAETVLAAFGGAGPFLITDVAAAAHLRRIIVPGLAAVFSAYGIGFSDIAQRYRRQLSSAAAGTVDAQVAELREAAERDMFAEGFEAGECRFEWSLAREFRDDEDVLPWSPGESLPPGLLDCDTAFIALRVTRPLVHAQFAPDDAAAGIAAVASGTRRVRIPGEGTRDLPVYALEQQPTGASAAGPCVLEEAYFTGRVGAGWTFRVNANRDTVLTRSGG